MNNRRSVSKSIAILIMVVFISPWLISGCAQDGTIKGRVTLDGDPVKDAEVRLLKNGDEVASSKTGSDGSYSIKNVKPGKYVLAIQEKKSYEEGRSAKIILRVTMEEGMNIDAGNRDLKR